MLTQRWVCGRFTAALFTTPSNWIKTKSVLSVSIGVSRVYTMEYRLLSEKVALSVVSLARVHAPAAPSALCCCYLLERDQGSALRVLGKAGLDYEVLRELWEVMEGF